MPEPNNSKRGVESHTRPTKSARSIAIGFGINSRTNCSESDKARWMFDASECYLGRLHTFVLDAEFPISVSLASFPQRTSSTGVAAEPPVPVLDSAGAVRGLEVCVDLRQ